MRAHVVSGLAVSLLVIGLVVLMGQAAPSVDADTAAIALSKRTNGQDADTPPGPLVLVGGVVEWTYHVTNTGNITLTEVVVSDDQGVAVECLGATLASQEAMVCTGQGAAVAGQYANTGTATGAPPVGPPVQASDPSHYFGVDAAIALSKRTNGQDADTPPGPLVLVGGVVEWTYHVTNTGNITLTGVVVSDDQRVAVECPGATLASQEAMVCTGQGVAVAGQYANTGTATGAPPVGPPVQTGDPSHYYGSTGIYLPLILR